MKGKEKFKNNVMTVVTGTQISFNEMKEGVMNPTKKTKIVMGATLALLVALMCVSFAFASGKSDSIALFDRIDSLLGKVYTGVLGISTGLMVVCAVVGLILAQVTTNQQKTMKWLDFVKKAALIWVVIILLSTIVNAIYTIATNGKGVEQSLDKFEQLDQ